MAREAATEPNATGWEHRFRFRSCQRPTTLILYFDTSALIKLVLFEQGSDIAHELWASPSRGASSVLALAEGLAALAAAHRSSRLTEPLYTEAVKSFELAYEQLVAIGVDEALTRSAGALAAEFALRGYDAVHLATALALAEQDVALVSWDQELCRAGATAGLPVLGG
ncbi:MAG TPA: type II toxin-antitoxin system VapC family toxin [Solirubrobacterales bacterium]|nr:type II toxin-antitoxin system VapC family toxin [Solirubrobacterales bacterium]